MNQTHFTLWSNTTNWATFSAKSKIIKCHGKCPTSWCKYAEEICPDADIAEEKWQDRIFAPDLLLWSRSLAPILSSQLCRTQRLVIWVGLTLQRCYFVGNIWLKGILCCWLLSNRGCGFWWDVCSCFCTAAAPGVTWCETVLGSLPHASGSSCGARQCVMSLEIWLWKKAHLITSVQICHLDSQQSEFSDSFYFGNVPFI